MNFASAVWLVKANHWKPKCFGRKQRFNNCHNHPNCLVKYECLKFVFETEKVLFT